MYIIHSYKRLTTGVSSVKNVRADSVPSNTADTDGIICRSSNAPGMNGNSVKKP